MPSQHEIKGQLVDLLRYRAERTQQKLDFTARPSGRPALALVRPFRPLTAREVAHRQVMVDFMRKAKGRG